MVPPSAASRVGVSLAKAGATWARSARPCSTPAPSSESALAKPRRLGSLASVLSSGCAFTSWSVAAWTSSVGWNSSPFLA